MFDYNFFIFVERYPLMRGGSLLVEDGSWS